MPIRSHSIERMRHCWFVGRKFFLAAWVCLCSTLALNSVGLSVGAARASAQEPVSSIVPVVPVPVEVPTSTPTPTTPPVAVLAPAPVLAPATNPPIRATFGTLEPYRGHGAWVDRFDWTAQWSPKRMPKVSWQTMDEMAAAGIETVYIQAAHSGARDDVLEPDKLIPMINRAHELNMHVVLWFLPSMRDVNTDLRKVVALANLEVDGLALNIEDYFTIKNVTERNRRVIAFSAALRPLLPNRMVTINIVEPILMDAVPDLWPQANGTPKTRKSFWRGSFPYRELAPHYDLWTIQTYWSNMPSSSGWRDGYRYTLENVRRLRAAVGRDDLPVHVTAGVGDRIKQTLPELNNLAGFVQAAREVNAVGVSTYDWVVWPRPWYPYLWNWRRATRDAASTGVPDPLVGFVLPPYVPTTPPLAPASSLTTTTTTPTVDGSVPSTTSPGPVTPAPTPTTPPTVPPTPTAPPDTI